MSSHQNLLGGPGPTLLPERSVPQAALADGTDPTEVARDYPDFSAAWAALAEKAMADGQHVAAYAYARTGYHRGLDQLRRAGWKGFGPIPWSHVPNQGFLRALGALARAAQAIGEDEEYQRCKDFLADADPQAASVLGVD
ncbi:MAG TPA: DUF3151 domain-containing protein [Pseudonocardiaceae bacterium]|jgi:hypothetical protein|nr:DUF3151 domain-containing protein [Pseudonocardiaceae bacterium]